MGPDWAPCGPAHPADGTAVSNITQFKNVFLCLGKAMQYFFKEFLQLKFKQILDVTIHTVTFLK